MAILAKIIFSPPGCLYINKTIHIFPIFPGFDQSRSNNVSSLDCLSLIVESISNSTKSACAETDIGNASVTNAAENRQLWRHTSHPSTPQWRHPSAAHRSVDNLFCGYCETFRGLLRVYRMNTWLTDSGYATDITRKHLSENVVDQIWYISVYSISNAVFLRLIMCTLSVWRPYLHTLRWNDSVKYTST